MGLFDVNVKKGQGAKFDSGNSGISSLMAYMMGQKKNAAASAQETAQQQEARDAGGVLTKATYGGETFEFPQAKSKVSAEALNAIQDAQVQLQNVRQIRQVAYKIPAGVKGLGSKSIAALLRGNFGGEETEEARLYNEFKEGTGRGLYRSITGDKRLSEKDAEFAKRYMWDQSESEGVRDLKFNFLEEALQARVDSLRGGAFTMNTVMDENGEMVQELRSDVKNLARQTRTLGPELQEIETALMDKDGVPPEELRRMFKEKTGLNLDDYYDLGGG